MASTWEAVRRRACRRYGLAPEVEDALLSVPLFLDRVNELLQELAQVGGGFREELILDLPASGVVALPGQVLRVLDGTVRLDLDGSGRFSRRVEPAQEEELRSLELLQQPVPVGVPEYYYLRRGNAGDAMLALGLYPRSGSAVEDGLRLECVVSPPAITDGESVLPLQAAEERFLIPGICLALAETELSRGRRDAPLELWNARWEKALVDYADLVEDSTRGASRRVRCVDGGEYY